MKRHLALFILSTLLFPGLVLGQDDGAAYHIKTQYDKFEDRTTVGLRDIHVTGSVYEGLQIGAVFAYSGTVLKTAPDKVAITAISTVKEYQFMTDRTLNVIADGQKLHFGEMSSTGRFELVKGMVQAESLMTIIFYDDFMKIVKAKTVEARLGTVEFSITTGQLKGFQELADMMRSK